MDVSKRQKSVIDFQPSHKVIYSKYYILWQQQLQGVGAVGELLIKSVFVATS